MMATEPATLEDQTCQRQESEIHVCTYWRTLHSHASSNPHIKTRFGVRNGLTSSLINYRNMSRYKWPPGLFWAWSIFNGLVTSVAIYRVCDIFSAALIAYEILSIAQHWTGRPCCCHSYCRRMSLTSDHSSFIQHICPNSTVVVSFVDLKKHSSQNKKRNNVTRMKKRW